MLTECRAVGREVLFVVLDLPERYRQAASTIGFEPVENGLARRFPAESRHLDRAYANFSRLVEDLILAEAGEKAKRWDVALEAFLRAVRGHDLNWYLVGSASLAVLNVDVVPGDVALAVDADGAHLLADILSDTLIEPIIPVSGWICDWWGRAFLGCRVEWVGEVHSSVDTPLPTDFGPTAASRLETVLWRGHTLRVPSLDLLLAVSERRGLLERAAKIREAIAKRDAG
jgi:hypothetical protein